MLGQMINVSAIHVVPVLKEVCTGHSLVPAQMTILMVVETNSKFDLYNVSLSDFSNTVYDRLSAEAADSVVRQICITVTGVILPQCN